MKKIAVIDLGTNGFRLYIAESTQSGQYNIILKETNELKLASEGIHRIGKKPFQNGVNTLKHFAHILTQHDVANIKAFGTAALRMADNGQEFIDTVKRETGIEIELISGTREAELIYKGMHMSVPLSIQPDVMVDVGGGSVEFIIANTEGVLWANSFNVGVAILKQKFHQNDPINAFEINGIENFLDTETSIFLEKLKEFQPKTPIIASGTLDFMVKILEGGYQKPYLEIPNSVFYQYYDEWLKLSEKQLFDIPDVPKDKIEMLAVSLVLMDWIIKKLNSDTIIASMNSMKAGILYEMSL